MALTTFASQAEITVLKQDPQAGNPLSRLNFTVGGSIRPQFQNMTGDDGKNSYKRNGFDGGTRFRFAADYYLFDDISWISYYELGVNIPAQFNWDNHYADGAHDTSRRMLYTGLKSDTWGTLTFGQQNSVYYDVVGAKTDIWDYDMIGQAPGNGINGDYDGSYRSRQMLKYKKTVGDADIYASYLFEDSEYLPGNGLRYKRKGGGSLGLDYHLTTDLTWGAAWNYTRADMRNPDNGDSKTYDQNILGTALSWTPDNWTFSAGGGWYQNFLTTKKCRLTITSLVMHGVLNTLRATSSQSVSMRLNPSSLTSWATALSTSTVVTTSASITAWVSASSWTTVSAWITSTCSPPAPTTWAT